MIWSKETRYAFEHVNPKMRENPNKGLVIKVKPLLPCERNPRIAEIIERIYYQELRLWSGG